MGRTSDDPWALTGWVRLSLQLLRLLGTVGSEHLAFGTQNAHTPSATDAGHDDVARLAHEARCDGSACTLMWSNSKGAQAVLEVKLQKLVIVSMGPDVLLQSSLMAPAHGRKGTLRTRNRRAHDVLAI